MTQCSLREFITVIINDQSMTDGSSIVTVLNSRNAMKGPVVAQCRQSRGDKFLVLAMTIHHSS